MTPQNPTPQMEPRYDVYLHPPIGTNYFRSYTQRFSRTDPVVFDVEVTFYIYVTLVKPTDPEFTAKGGRIYIIVVFNGSVRTTNAATVKFGLRELSDAASPVDQLPVPGSEAINGDTRVYTIDFTQTMSMYNNGGNSAFAFPARYNRIFSLTGYSQNKHDLTRWSLKRDDSAKTHDELLVTNGLQVYETNKFAYAPCQFWIEFPYNSYTFQFSLDYRAETMANAVVG